MVLVQRRTRGWTATALVLCWLNICTDLSDVHHLLTHGGHGIFELKVFGGQGIARRLQPGWRAVLIRTTYFMCVDVFLDCLASYMSQRANTHTHTHTVDFLQGVVCSARLRRAAPRPRCPQRLRPAPWCQHWHFRLSWKTRRPRCPRTVYLPEEQCLTRWICMCIAAFTVSFSFTAEVIANSKNTSHEPSQDLLLVLRLVLSRVSSLIRANIQSMVQWRIHCWASIRNAHVRIAKGSNTLRQTLWDVCECNGCRRLGLCDVLFEVSVRVMWWVSTLHEQLESH